jgi:hypothetical protein
MTERKSKRSKGEGRERERGDRKKISQRVKVVTFEE